MALRPDDNQAILPFPAPLDMAASLSFLSRNGDDCLDRWDGERWLRVLVTGARRIPISCRVRGTPEEPCLEVRVADAADLAVVREAASHSFIPAGSGFGALLLRDPVLAGLNRRFPGIRQVRQFDLFYGLVRAISAQQVNLRWATVVRRRLAEAVGDQLWIGDDCVYALRPEAVAALRVADLRALQFTTHKAESILAVAGAMAGGALNLERLAAMSDVDAMGTLTALRGIGPWSAEWILVRCLGRARLVAGDLAVRRAVARFYLGREAADEREVRRAVAHWGDAATTAQAILLYAYGRRALEESRQ